MSEELETIKCSKCENIFYTVHRDANGDRTYTASKPGVVESVEGEQENYRIICPLCRHPEVVSGARLPFKKLKLLREIPDPWKFVEAARIDRSYQEIIKSISHDKIRAVAVNFVASIDRLIAIAQIAPLSTGLSGLYQNRFRGSERGILPIEKTEEAWGEAMNRNVANAKLFVSPLAPETREQALEIGYSELRNWTRQHGEMSPGVEAILMAQIVLAWTAYEVLSEDLWVAALNARPRLGFIAINAELKEGEPIKDREEKLKKKFQIPVWILERDPNFQLQTGMGTLLKEKCDFGRREEAEEAYQTVFYKDKNKLNTIIGDGKLGWVAAVRNCIVHEAGKATRQFESLTSLHPELNQIRVGNPIPMNGNRASELVSVVIEKGTALIDFVDSWIKNNPA
jgi:hypothetical protein